MTLRAERTRNEMIEEFTDFLGISQKIVSEPDGAEGEEIVFSWALAWSTKFNFGSRPFYKDLQILPNYNRGCKYNGFITVVEKLCDYTTLATDRTVRSLSLDYPVKNNFSGQAV
ncbi:hypothetical protein HGM15179_013496 [Zosterops borbonicus]|uniref:Uncharacterized protein n=1 Tax=Zosterops borbonicus TaxID=364589 RepID=A0A8K1G8Q4_9PASS|nr:hypothetical protein HGM15179_013496 [Zosterops borbonicus]